MHNFLRSLVPRPARHFMPQTHKRVVVIGGGPTGMLCADRLRHQFDVTLVDSKEFFEFTPSILRAVVEPQHVSDITFDYREVLEGQLGIEFVKGEASSIDVSTAGATGAGTVTVSGRTGPSKLYFDYCVVSVGTSNGIWKPRLPGESRPNAVGAAVAGETRADGVHQADDERTLDVRRGTLRALRERIAASRAVHIVGAGLVGVELAGEVAHFFPRVKVTLVDGAPDVVPQLGEAAREYARGWLQHRNVTLNLGRPFSPKNVGDDQVVLWCVGTKTRSAGLFADPSVALRSNGQVRVNRQMQVLHNREGGSASSVNIEGSSRRGNLETLGQGTIFAVGDAAAVEGVPTAQMILHGEETAAVAVQNIEAAEDVASPFGSGQGVRQIETQQPFLLCTSLGPSDGMFSTQTELMATGSLAAIQKQMIETTKMAALQGHLPSSLVWYPVH